MDILAKHIEHPKTVSEIELSDDNRHEYMIYHNEAFFDVSNSMTIDDNEINLIKDNRGISVLQGI